MRSRSNSSVGLFLAFAILGASMAACPKKQVREFDMTPPDAITDFVALPGALPGQVRVDWTATGDDGTLGTASVYVLVYDTVNLTEAGFDSAVAYAQGWAPLPSGQTEVRVHDTLVTARPVFS